MALSLWGLWVMPSVNIEVSAVWPFSLFGNGHFHLTSEQASYLLMSLIGFFVYGPQLLVGIAAAEYVSKKAACTANGFVGCWAYIGAAATGAPLGWVIDKSWNYYFWLLIGCSLITFLTLFPLTMKKKKSSNLPKQ